MKQQKYLFYCGKSNIVTSTNVSLESDYTFEIWRPKIYKIAPRGLFFKVFLIWWVFRYLGLFSSSNYRIFIIYHKKSGKVAHYSVVLPKHFRTPFMEKNDLQIGPVGTFETHRRKGLASYAIQEILKFYKKQNSKFWYIVRKENEISRRCIEKMDFIAYGEGIKKKRFVGGLFDTYIIEKKF